jgi:predicted GNAT superfamily acetyltransferase
MHFLDISQSFGEISGLVVHSHEENALSHLFDPVVPAHHFIEWARTQNLTIAIINNIFIEPRARGGGAGRKLIDGFATGAMAKGATLLMLVATRLESELPSSAINHWYTACGFELFGEAEDGAVMIKSVSNPLIATAA